MAQSSCTRAVMFNLRQHLNTPDFVMSDSRDTSPIHFKQNKAYCHKEDKITLSTIPEEKEIYECKSTKLTIFKEKKVCFFLSDLL